MPLRCSLALLVLGSAALHAQRADRPAGFPAGCGPAEVQVMLLGTYHGMATRHYTTANR